MWLSLSTFLQIEWRDRTAYLPEITSVH